MRHDVCTLLKAQTEVIKEQQESLDEWFLTELWEQLHVYCSRKYNPKFPKVNRPEFHEMMLLLDTIRQTNNINVKNGKGHTLLSLVVYTDERKTLDLLLSHPKIDIGVKNDQNNTLLMRAVIKGQNMKLMLEPILAHELMDLSILTARGMGEFTPLMLAEKYLQQETGEAKKTEYIEVIALLRAKETGLVEKLKTSKTLENTVKSTITKIVT